MTDTTNEDAAAAAQQAAAHAKAAVKKAKEEFSAALATLTDFQNVRKELEDAVAAFDKRIADMKTGFEKECEPLRKRMLEVAHVTMPTGHSPPTSRAAYSDRTAALMAKFSLLAYKRFDDTDGRALFEAVLDAAGFKLLEVFNHGSTQAFLAQNDQFCVLAFRGTTSKKDWEINQQIQPRKTEIPGHPKHIGVHGGFLNAFLPLEVDMRVALHEKTGNRPIYITGHSLGGALALVASAVLGGTRAGASLQPLGDRIAAVYTYGAPRVGGRDFEECVKAPHYRVVNSSDLVPWVPPSWLFGYMHSGDVRYLRGYGQGFRREQTPASLTLTALYMLVLYLFGAAYWLRLRSHGIEDHQIERYIVKLDKIAADRSTWL